MKLWRFPIIHFLLLGGLLFWGKDIWQREVIEYTNQRELRIPDYQVKIAFQDFFQKYGRPPSPEEQKAVFESLVDQEILLQYGVELGLHRQTVAYQRLAKVVGFTQTDPNSPGVTYGEVENAIDMGLHRSDLILRKMLIDGAKRVIRSVVLVRQPTEEMLKTYLQQYPDEFKVPTKIKITQLLSNGLKHKENTHSHSLGLLEKAMSSGISPMQVSEQWGDKVFVDANLPAMTEKDLERSFGVEFVEQLNDLPEGEWSGPITSRYGSHVVFVHERAGSHLPPLARIEEPVKQQFLYKLANEWLTLRLQQLREGYEIVQPEILS